MQGSITDMQQWLAGHTTGCYAAPMLPAEAPSNLIPTAGAEQLFMRMQVFAWGLNSAGQLGMGDSVARKSPCAIEALWAMPVQQLAAGLACCCVPDRFCLPDNDSAISSWQTSAHQSNLLVARKGPAPWKSRHHIPRSPLSHLPTTANPCPSHCQWPCRERPQRSADHQWVPLHVG